MNLSILHSRYYRVGGPPKPVAAKQGTITPQRMLRMVFRVQVRNHHMSYSLYIGVTKEDTGSLDYSSYIFLPHEVYHNS